MTLYSRRRLGPSACPLLGPARGHATPAQAHSPRTERGFTLIELLTVLVVSAVLIAIAIPNFRVLILNNRLTTAANEVVVAINMARVEAIKRNTTTQLCSNNSTNNTSDALGASCTGVGAVVASFVDATGKASGQVVAAPIAALTTPLQLSGDATALRFTSQGIAQKAGTTTAFGNLVIDICSSQLSANQHRQINMVGGSTVTVVSKTGACP